MSLFDIKTSELLIQISAYSVLYHALWFKEVWRVCVSFGSHFLPSLFPFQYSLSFAEPSVCHKWYIFVRAIRTPFQFKLIFSVIGLKLPFAMMMMMVIMMWWFRVSDGLHDDDVMVMVMMSRAIWKFFWLLRLVRAPNLSDFYIVIDHPELAG